MSNTAYNNLEILRKVFKDVSVKKTFSNFNFLSNNNFNLFLDYLKFNDIVEYDFSEFSQSSFEKSMFSKNFNGTEFLLMKLKKFSFKGYNQDTSQMEFYIDKFIDNVLSLIPLDLDKSGTNLLFYELLINIYIHSEFNNAYMICQNFSKSNSVAIFIIDDGITIPGSLEDCGNSFINDSNAIFEAINGCSSDKYEDGIIGRGLNTSACISSLGFGEELLIASRNGLCIVSEKIVYNFACPDLQIDGTIICLILNNTKIKNIYDYVSKINFEKIDVS